SREAFDAAGGFDEGLYVAEDIALGRALARQGRLVILRTPVITSARKMHTYSLAEKLGFTLRFLVSPRRIARTRDALPLWYGPRGHPKPGPPTAESAGAGQRPAARGRGAAQRYTGPTPASARIPDAQQQAPQAPPRNLARLVRRPRSRGGAAVR